MQPVIHARHLSKRYAIGERWHYLALRDVLARAISTPARMFRERRRTNISPVNGNGAKGATDPYDQELVLSKARDGHDTWNSKGGNEHRRHIWALDGVSFDVRQGEVVGIIGRNGAGKTTLLKILARVTKPTRGYADVRGRMGSLLEVGTGFHPELTGRENVYLSGAILGMSRAEIRRKFHEIVGFAEVEKFIDTAVKHYSVGMRMRLAFAVAAHLEPEILLVDEVLSVGDLEFQKKCLGKMGKVAEGGRTILFVSHQMNQIRRLCQRALWVEGGEIRADGPATPIVNQYEAASCRQNGSYGSPGRPDRDGSKAWFQSWEILEPRSDRPHSLNSFGPVTVRSTVRVNQPLRRVHHGIVLYDSDRQLLWGTGFDGLELQPGIKHFIYKLSSLPLRPGAYSWFATLYDEDDLVDSWECLPELMVETPPVTHRLDEWAGFLNIPCGLSVVSVPDIRTWKHDLATASTQVIS
jgi:ABC-type polysaccharide/polyol phosphate transport system ATPase subunit